MIMMMKLGSKKLLQRYPVRSKFFLFIIALFLGGPACTLFFGTIKPSEIKSTHYQIGDLTKSDLTEAFQKSGNWEKLAGTERIEDIAFQEHETGSIISMNSSCKGYEGAHVQESLADLAQGLLLGLRNRKILEQNEIQVAHLPALETTVRGMMNNENVILRTVVVRNENCVYDLIFITKPPFFQKDVATFSQFVSTLKFK